MELLSHEETLALIRAAAHGDAQARDTLTRRNMALVGSIVRGFLHRGVEYDDLMQIGSLGLLKAIDGYDPSFQVRFSTYAVPMIAGEIKRFLRDDGLIKVSRSLKENAARIFRAQEAHRKKTGLEPTLEELAAQTDMPPEEIVHALEAARGPVSIYEPVFEDSGCLLDLLQTDQSAQLTDQLLLSQLLDRLTPRERRLIQLRFFADKTQSQIAKILGISQVQVSRLLTKTLAKLRREAET